MFNDSFSFVVKSAKFEDRDIRAIFPYVPIGNL